ncbi:alpha/beta hydrolase [Alcaligenes sp. 13f]|uniref:alpha/beta fold hydrolase n=1 Tax=Alcaligenes sp. 13f TaxID=2841924 RepID=UPI001CF61B96|nr:alpha/beta hydrolase [Alcaligenes sp. 13f]MCB4320767.1 alpha/beta hydrolase [Alcaligenes sp. 13f]
MMSKIRLLSNKRVAHYLEQGAGEPLVLIHGVGMQAEAWYPQMAFFAATHQVISVDMPGHGQSTPLMSGATLADYVDWMIDFLENMALSPVNLCGHSMGALIAAGVTIERPDLVRRLAVVNGVHRRDQAARQAVIARAQSLTEGYVDVQTPLTRWFETGPAHAPIVSKVKGWLEQVDLQGYATAYSAFAYGDVLYADRWSEVQCPVLALTGADDPNSTAQMSRTMASLSAKGTAVVLECERHMVNLTAPDQVNQALTRWLAVQSCNYAVA